MPFVDRKKMPHKPWSDFEKRRLQITRHDERPKHNPEHYTESYVNINFQKQHRPEREDSWDKYQQEKERERQKAQSKTERKDAEAQEKAECEAPK